LGFPLKIWAGQSLDNFGSGNSQTVHDFILKDANSSSAEHFNRFQSLKNISQLG
jgi:hypothetical protein